MKILITGTSGLIGKWTAEKALCEGHEILGIDIRPNPHPHLLPHCQTLDILDLDSLTQALHHFQPEIIIHLAARTDLGGTSLDDYLPNTLGVSNLCKAIRATPSVRRAIYTSSQLVCPPGYQPKGPRDYCPHTTYGQSKVQTETITIENNGACEEWCITRPTTVWGPHMSSHYRRLLSLIRRGLYFHCGSAPLYKSYAYAGNIAHQYLRLATAPAEAIHTQTFYLADYQPLSLREYANGLQQRLGARPIPTLPLPLARVLALTGDLFVTFGWRNFPFNSFRLRNILTEYQFDLSQTKAVCGPLPYSFKEGLDATVEWHLNQHP